MCFRRRRRRRATSPGGDQAGDQSECVRRSTRRRLSRQRRHVRSVRVDSRSHAGGSIGGADDARRCLPPPVRRPEPPEPVRVGGTDSPAAEDSRRRSGYPPIAQAARVQGIVIIEATIGADGRVRRMRASCDRSRCSIRRRLTRCASGNTRRRCSTACRCR